MDNDTNKGLATGVTGGKSAIIAGIVTYAYHYVPYQGCCSCQITPCAAKDCSVTKLTCGPSSGTQGAVTRGATVYCALTSVPSGAATSNWKFVDGGTQVTPPSNPGTSWSGTAVEDGTVSVKVTKGGISPTLSATLSVNPRTGWNFSAVNPQKVNHAAGTGNCAAILPPLRMPPEAFQDLAKSCLYQAWSTPTVATVTGGPNKDFKYVSSQISNTGTLYQWHKNPDSENTQSTFYQHQTGTNGCILGSNLATQTERHEAGLTSTVPPRVQSHWYNYKSSQDVTTNNLGAVAEASLGLPSVSAAQFQQAVMTDLADRALIIFDGTILENIYPVNFSHTGTFLGNVNWASNYLGCQ